MSEYRSMHVARASTDLRSSLFTDAAIDRSIDPRASLFATIRTAFAVYLSRKASNEDLKGTDRLLFISFPFHPKAALAPVVHHACGVPFSGERKIVRGIGKFTLSLLPVGLFNFNW